MNRALLFTIQCALTGLLAFLPLPSIPAAAQQTPLYFPPVRAQPSPADQELFQACSKGDTEKIADLLQRGANPNAGNGAPLHLAASHGRAQSVEILLKSGANPRTPDSDGKTPLHHAIH